MSYLGLLLEANEPWLRDLVGRDPERVERARRRHDERQECFARTGVLPGRETREAWLDGMVQVWKRADSLGAELRLCAQVEFSQEQRELAAALLPRPMLLAPEFTSWIQHLGVREREQAQEMIQRLRVGLTIGASRRRTPADPISLHECRIGTDRRHWAVASLHNEALLLLGVGVGSTEAATIAQRLAQQHGLELQRDIAVTPPPETVSGEYRDVVAASIIYRLDEACRIDQTQPATTLETRRQRRGLYRRCGMMATDSDIREWIEALLGLQHHLDQTGVTLQTSFQFPFWNRPGTRVSLAGHMRLLPLILAPAFRQWLDALDGSARTTAWTVLRCIQAGVQPTDGQPRGLDRYRIELGGQRYTWLADRHADVCYLAGVDLQPERAERIVLGLVREVDGRTATAT